MGCRIDQLPWSLFKSSFMMSSQAKHKMDKLVECKLKENVKLEGRDMREIFSQIGILRCALEKPLEEEACREIQYHPLKVTSAQEIECQSEYSYIKRLC